MSLVIDVVDGGWGTSDAEDVRQVCLSAAECFSGAIAERPIEPIRIGPSPYEHPRVLHQRLGSGHVEILLSTIDRLWAQCAFQFAHEFCHVMANLSLVPQPDAPSKWIEEVLCETASLFALREMGKRWVSAPPYPNWSDYAPNLTAYANHRIDEGRTRCPDAASLPTWLAERLPDLEADAYRRDDNLVIASYLLEVFEADPEAWRAVRYLNMWGHRGALSLGAYFESWRTVAPYDLHKAIQAIETVLTGHSQP